MILPNLKAINAYAGMGTSTPLEWEAFVKTGMNVPSTLTIVIDMHNASTLLAASIVCATRATLVMVKFVPILTSVVMMLLEHQQQRTPAKVI